VEILRGLKERYELHHRRHLIQTGLWWRRSRLADRYIADRCLPARRSTLRSMSPPPSCRMEVTVNSPGGGGRRKPELRPGRTGPAGAGGRTDDRACHGARAAPPCPEPAAGAATALAGPSGAPGRAARPAPARRRPAPRDSAKRSAMGIWRGRPAANNDSCMGVQQRPPAPSKTKSLSGALAGPAKPCCVSRWRKATFADVVARLDGQLPNAAAAGRPSAAELLDARKPVGGAGHRQPRGVAGGGAIDPPARAGMQGSRRPDGLPSLPRHTGVGKTELAKALAGGACSDEEEALGAPDMSEFMEPQNGRGRRLLGAPSGLRGLRGEKGGQLNRGDPAPALCRVAAAMEVEKAHPERWFNLFACRCLMTARLTDSQGRVPPWTSATRVVVMTSNLARPAPILERARQGPAGRRSKPGCRP